MDNLKRTLQAQSTIGALIKSNFITAATVGFQQKQPTF